MSNTNSVRNHLTNKTSYTDGGKCNTKYTIYAAECTKHNLLYIGQSSQKLNCRFNSHRSDARVKRKACELTQHFSQSKNCKIDNDLRVHILQNNLEDSSFERMEYFEDHWITRLDTNAPDGMNTKLNDFAKTFYQLFNIDNIFLSFSHCYHFLSQFLLSLSPVLYPVTYNLCHYWLTRTFQFSKFYHYYYPDLP